MARKKYTIEDMQKLAEEKGGKCLSEEFYGISTKLNWQCSKEHNWWATPRSIIHSKSWCLYCSGRARKTIEDMQDIAIERNGKCLSEKYVNTDTKLKWQCSEGHEWKATPDNVKHGSWCPYCSGRVGITIEDMQNIAAGHNGKCLSKKYVGSKTKLKWQCSERHIWEAIPSSVKRGSWCPKCARKKRNLKP